jgi:hypothetical protein
MTEAAPLAEAPRIRSPLGIECNRVSAASICLDDEHSPPHMNRCAKLNLTKALLPEMWVVEPVA